MIKKYNRWMGVPKGNMALMKVVCFGGMGGFLYDDKILAYAKTKQELVDYCEKQEFKLKDPGGRNEYFICNSRQFSDQSLT